MQSYLISAILS
uniref:Uncharacterized protein n=1 Tax=Arundo donax TaxID=35708 RepID=A0A0A9ANS6_ARUDO